MTEPEKFIYFIRPTGAVGPIKIGCTRFPDYRLDDLCRWSPVPLELITFGVGNFLLERHLHDRFDHCRSHKEWFDPTPELLAAIEMVKSGESIESAFRVTRRARKATPSALVYRRTMQYVPTPTQEAAE